ncbi:hypothetical protein SUGI_0474510 [Cryptomeria japonica]|nr:hypothetical protein SUGI_0474510 [Cryptomeria japonica]
MRADADILFRTPSCVPEYSQGNLRGAFAVLERVTGCLKGLFPFCVSVLCSALRVTGCLKGVTLHFQVFDRKWRVLQAVALVMDCTYNSSFLM